MESIVLVIILAFILDCLLGDPEYPFHPIRLMGKFISLNISIYKKRNNSNKIFSFIFGSITSILTITLAFILTKLIIVFFAEFNVYIGFIVKVILCYTIIAPRALMDESIKVYNSINEKNLLESRKNLSYIVGRDTNNLNYEQIIKATVETISENLSDGVIAPILFVFIGGVPLGMAYKAVNTLDSMIGYRNESYEYFGKFAAKLDDIVNFIPARLSALIMVLSTKCIGEDVKGAIEIYRRDRNNHKSPNSAHTESVCAGALGLSLGGGSYYHGKLVLKPTIGDDINKPDIRHIVQANKLMYGTTVLFIFIISIIGILLY